MSAATNNIDKERNSIQNSNVCKEFPKQISLNSITYSSYPRITKNDLLYKESFLFVFIIKNRYL